MWYAVWMLEGKPKGFITRDVEGREVPHGWVSEKEAVEAMKEHILQDQVEYIEL